MNEAEEKEWASSVARELHSALEAAEVARELDESALEQSLDSKNQRLDPVMTAALRKIVKALIPIVDSWQNHVKGDRGDTELAKLLALDQAASDIAFLLTHAVAQTLGRPGAPSSEVRRQSQAVAEWALTLFGHFVACPIGTVDPFGDEQDDIARIKEVYPYAAATSLVRLQAQLRSLREIDSIAEDVPDILQLAEELHLGDRAVRRLITIRGRLVRIFALQYSSVAEFEKSKQPSIPEQELLDLSCKVLVAWNRTGRPRTGEQSKWELANRLLREIGLEAESPEALSQRWKKRDRSEIPRGVREAPPPCPPADARARMRRLAREAFLALRSRE